jgi:hypothetical protein
MGNFLSTQNVFSCGEVSPEFYATGKTHGLMKLENMDVLQSGGLKRRAGLKSIKTISGEAILVPFVVNETEKYLVLVRNTAIDIYSDDVKIKSIPAPWATADLNKLQYAQRFNKLFFVHPDYQPKVLTRIPNNFDLSGFSFRVNPDVSVNMPFTRFEDTDGITITITNSDIDNNHAVFTTSADFFTNESVGQTILAISKQWTVESVQSNRIATVYTNGSFTLPGSPVSDWYECVFSNKRGWPSCVSFCQNRLVFGGTPSYPNGIWMSKTGDYYNFDTGTGLDDDAIYTELLSAQHHQICTIVSSDKLQILTSVGEWAISSSPLTPSSVSIKQHTSVGSITDRYLPPQQIEGSTVFISKSGKDIRELDLDALGENYNATDLCALSKHLMNAPISMAYSQQQHKLFVVMQDGYMAVLNKYSGTDISAWGKYITDGEFKYVCVFDDFVYVIVDRQGTHSLEKFDTACLSDANIYDFSYKISAFPIIVNGHCPNKIRIRKASLRVLDTKTVFLNGQRIEIPNAVYTDDNPGYSGDLSVNLLGTECETMNSLWTISSDEQLPATILSVSIDGWYSI